MSSHHVREWFRTEMQAWSAAHVAPDPLAAPFFETVNQEPDEQLLPNMWSTLLYVVPAQRRTVAIGAHCTDEEGRVDVTVLARAGVNHDSDACTAADALADWFRGKHTMLSASEAFEVLEPEPPLTLLDAVGRWFMATVSVPYILRVR